MTTIDGRPVREWLEATVTRRRDRNGYSTDHQALHAACHWGLADRSGTPTAGMSAAKMTLPVPSGLFAVRCAVRSHMQRWNKGRGLEGIGVAPTETLPYSPAALLSGVDTQIRRAEELLQAGFPPEAVDYAPPAQPAK